MKLSEVYPIPQTEYELDYEIDYILMNFCETALGSPPIFRGMKSILPDIFVSKPPKNRKAKDLPNFVNLIIDEIHPDWESFPKRSESWICSTNFSAALDYGFGHGGKVFRVFPYDDPKIAVLNTADFWNMTESHGITTYKINIILKHLQMSIYGESENFQNPTNKTQVLDLLKKIDSLIENNEQSIIDYLESTMNMTITNNHSLTDILMDMLGTKDKDIRLVNLSNLPQVSDREVWFSHEALFINEKIFNNSNEFREVRKMIKELRGIK